MVAAYAKGKPIDQAELLALMGAVHGAFAQLANASRANGHLTLVPAVPISKSVTPEYIVCLEDGKRFKSLKRHLKSQYSMTPGDYRKKWGLPPEYPMVAPNYAAARSRLAKKMGLGTRKES